MALIQSILSMIALICYSTMISGSSLSYECLSIFENTRLTDIEPSTTEDAITLLECHQTCREMGYDSCSIYVFDSEENLCKMYTETDGLLQGVIEEDILWNTLVQLKPDCFDDRLIGRGRRYVAMTTTPSSQQPTRPGQWGQWGACSVMCGGGTRTRTRVCPYGGSSGCPNMPLTENQPCNNQSCCTQWSNWSPCPVTCGQGVQKRTRRCMVEAVGTPTGYASQEKAETQNCTGRQPSCAQWGQWAPWSECSASCNGGTQNRQRPCSVPGQCPGNGTETKTCNTQPCAEWSAWGPWSPCSDTCGGGWQIRERNCTQAGRPSTQCPGDQKEKHLCNEYDCPTFGPWQEWGPCSKTCGGGSRNRERQCVNDARICSGVNATLPVCVCTNVDGGLANETEQCNPETCAEWAEWQEWSPCSVTCGNGTQTRKRTCNPPGGECVGTDTESKDCNAGECYTWSSWSEWGECTTLCGGGSRSRARQCPLEGGCPGLNDESDICNMNPCPDWGSWSPWSDCTLSCGGGQRSRTRSCALPSACTPGEPYEVDPQPCNPETCSTWSPWTEWGACSKTCGQGNRNRKRTCSPIADGCLGRGDDVEPCVVKPCVLGTNWSDWSPCTATCGGGTQTRSRATCPAGPPTCPIEEGSQPCNPQPCPQWNAWGQWGQCSKTCGGGQRVRTRSCPVKNGCVGSASDIDPRPCNDFGCGSGRRR